MRWKAKYTKADYQHGTTRLKRSFAWWPLYISGNMVWFETYETLQVYKVVKETAIIEEQETLFEIGSWINLDRRCA